MVQVVNEKSFSGISPKNLLEATFKASENFQIRAFYESKKEILNTSKYTESEFFEIYDAMLDAETERRIVLERLRGNKPLFLEEIIKLIKEFPPDNVVRDVIYLKEQGYIEEQVEIKTKLVIKKIKGEEKEVEEKEYFYRYQVKKLSDDFVEKYFEPVSIVFEAEVCCQCGWCSSICPVNAISVTADLLEIDEEKCMKCGLCFSVCPRTFSIDQAYKTIKQLDKKLNWSDKIGSYFNAYSGSTTNDAIKKVK
ncbi:MAG: 4Fe-4S binding protein, partial [Candidatus Thorarchaeota archaeon]